MAGTIADYVYHEIQQGTADQRILDTVVDRGYSRDYADGLLARCKETLPEWEAEQRLAAQEIRQAERETNRSIRRAERGDWWKTIRIGIGTCVGSVVYIVLIVLIAIAIDLWTTWGLFDTERLLYFIIVGVIAFLGGILIILKGVYHAVRWW